jgi:hypothetical protein
MTRPAHVCPSCGTRIPTTRTLGRPKSAYYTAEGRRMHVEEWAAEFNVSIQTIRNWIRHPLGFEKCVQLHRRDR